MQISRHHLQTQLQELQGRYDALTKRIAALDADIGREFDGERRLTLQERRNALTNERDGVSKELAEIEYQLANAPADQLTSVPVSSLEEEVPGVLPQETTRPVSPVIKTRFWAWALIGLTLIVAGVAVVFFLSGPGNPALTDTAAPAFPDPESTAVVQATIAQTADGLAILGATPPMPEIGPLPATAPPLTTTIALSDGCPVGYDQVTADLSDQLKALDPPMRIARLSPITNTQQATVLGMDSGADLVVWCQNEGQITYHFRILDARGAPEVIEPASLTLESPTASQVARLTYALGRYLRRDYDEAARVLATAAGFEDSPETKAVLQFMTGNSLLFQRRYTEATGAFQQALVSHPDWEDAHYNLGVAQMNASWESYDFAPALSSFSTTLQLAPDSMLPIIMRGLIWTWLGNVNVDLAIIDQAQEACQQAMQANDPLVSAQAKSCLAYAQIVSYALTQGHEPLLVDGLELTGLATPHWAVPLLAQGTADYVLWRIAGDMIAQARSLRQLPAALQAAADDVHLEHSRLDYQGALGALEALYGSKR